MGTPDYFIAHLGFDGLRYAWMVLLLPIFKYNRVGKEKKAF